jgi:RNA polymerase-interacting CarD/CdnL/TRCF family regulator
MSKKMSLQEQEGWKNQERAYEQGLLAGYTKSIVLIRHLQRSDGRSHCNEEVREILDEAMELIAENIEANNNE